MTEAGLGISQNDLRDAALVFSRTAPTITAAGFGEFLRMQAQDTQDDDANEILLALVADGQLREVGPGTYSLPKGATQ